MTSDQFPSTVCYDLTVAIADSGTVSTPADLNGTTLCGVFIPAGLDNTTLAFQACDTIDGTYLSVIDGAGSAISKTVAASRYLPLDPALFLGIRYLRLVTGAQTGAVTLTLATKPR